MQPCFTNASWNGISNVHMQSDIGLGTAPYLRLNTLQGLVVEQYDPANGYALHGVQVLSGMLMGSHEFHFQNNLQRPQPTASTDNFIVVLVSVSSRTLAGEILAPYFSIDKGRTFST
eukprot:1140278-Pelagomonas_calceolata.AAC.5